MEKEGVEGDGWWSSCRIREGEGKDEVEVEEVDEATVGKSGGEGRVRKEKSG